MSSLTDVDRATMWAMVKADVVDSVNEDLEPGRPTVDVAIHYPSNLDRRHQEKVNIDLLLDGFRAAKEVFAAADVQLRLLEVRTGHLDPRLFMLRAFGKTSDMPPGEFSNMYIEAERRPTELSDDALTAFRSMIGDTTDGERTVHIVVLQAVFMDHYEPVVPSRVFQKQTIETSGLSFPGYIHGDRIPRDLRGVITITNLRRTDYSWKTIAHELGHKLMNVSHEHRGLSPAHEVLSDEGLMCYGIGTEIARGAEGRFHYERLHRSPFIYVESPEGERTYNPDYQAGGFYYDPIYEGVSVFFELGDEESPAP